MNGMTNPIIFYLVAFAIIIFSILTIKFKNIFYSLLSAVVVFFGAGLIFYILGSEYNAIIQIAIYGVAVPIILGLAIMFTDLKTDNKVSEKKDTIMKYLVFLFGGIFVLATVYLILTSFVISSSNFVSNYLVNTQVQVMNAFAQGIYVKYVWAFEIISLILTIVVAGLSIISKKEEN